MGNDILRSCEPPHHADPCCAGSPPGGEGGKRNNTNEELTEIELQFQHNLSRSDSDGGTLAGGASGSTMGSPRDVDSSCFTVDQKLVDNTAQQERGTASTATRTTTSNEKDKNSALLQPEMSQLSAVAAKLAVDTTSRRTTSTTKNTSSWFSRLAKPVGEKLKTRMGEMKLEPLVSELLEKMVRERRLHSMLREEIDANNGPLNKTKKLQHRATEVVGSMQTRNREGKNVDLAEKTLVDREEQTNPGWPSLKEFVKEDLIPNYAKDAKNLQLLVDLMVEEFFEAFSGPDVCAYRYLRVHFKECRKMESTSLGSGVTFVLEKMAGTVLFRAAVFAEQLGRTKEVSSPRGGGQNKKKKKGALLSWYKQQILHQNKAEHLGAEDGSSPMIIPNSTSTSSGSCGYSMDLEILSDADADRLAREHIFPHGIFHQKSCPVSSTPRHDLDCTRPPAGEQSTPSSPGKSTFYKLRQGKKEEDDADTESAAVALSPGLYLRQHQRTSPKNRGLQARPELVPVDSTTASKTSGERTGAPTTSVNILRARDGSPIYVARVKPFLERISGVLSSGKTSDAETQKAYVLDCLRREQVIRSCGSTGFVAIWDAANCGMFDAAYQMAALAKYGRVVSGNGPRHFPDGIMKVYIINAPSFINYALTIVDKFQLASEVNKESMEVTDTNGKEILERFCCEKVEEGPELSSASGRKKMTLATCQNFEELREKLDQVWSTSDRENYSWEMPGISFSEVDLEDCSASTRPTTASSKRSSTLTDDSPTTGRSSRRERGSLSSTTGDHTTGSRRNSGTKSKSGAAAPSMNTSSSRTSKQGRKKMKKPFVAPPRTETFTRPKFLPRTAPELFSLPRIQDGRRMGDVDGLSSSESEPEREEAPCLRGEGDEDTVSNYFSCDSEQED
ncbi:unnamed protein product [Amoebophrya sp. A120]|nr:unnamed protein product [Amoebophrya sp. A120]|eukprot:GSA120T00024082001.1